MRKKGLEPLWPCGHQLLRLARLPVPPLPLSKHYTNPSARGASSQRSAELRRSIAVNIKPQGDSSYDLTSQNRMNIKQATRSYETWMRRCTPVVEAHLRTKHARMKEDPFCFFRGTFYRWVQLWPRECPNLLQAPKVLGVGDLHIENFGTWRDGEGRLCWGVNDFDEAYTVPYTNDLVRLAASVKTAIDSEHLALRLKDACRAILAGYTQALKDGGRPIVLAEHGKNLKKLGFESLKPATDFWKKLNALPLADTLPQDAERAVQKSLPEPDLKCKVISREAGMGSLGQRRFVAITDWRGGCIAREAKAMTPSAYTWSSGHVGHCQSHYQQAIAGAVRSHDPFQEIVGSWLIRRLSPDTARIEMTDLPKQRDEETLLHAMGSETANVHLGTKRQAKNILADLQRQKTDWLLAAAKKMAKAMRSEWKDYKHS